jgi:hypothetical protein
MLTYYEEDGQEAHPANTTVQHVHADAHLQHLSPELVEEIGIEGHMFAVDAHECHSGCVVKYPVLDGHATVVNQPDHGHMRLRTEASE